MSVRRPRSLLLLALGLLLHGVAAQAADTQLDERLRHRIETAVGTASWQVAGQRIHARNALTRFYRERLYAPAWIRDAAPQPAVRELVGILERAPEHGLRPADYHLPAILALLEDAQRKPADPGLASDLELLLSDGALLYATHLLAGRVNPVTIDAEWHAEMRGGDIVAIVSRGLGEGRLAATLAGLAPAAPGYRRLQAALAHWSALPPEGADAIAGGELLRRGMSGARVAQLRRRLLNASGDEFDRPLEDAVKAFQRGQGLEDDGLVGPATLVLLNRRPRDVVALLQANLERWRWLPENLGERHILVNIADFQLVAREAYRPVLRMKVIVGRDYRKTPVFTAPISYLVLNPYWEVPTKIAQQDLLPKFIADPAYFETMGFELFRGWGAEQQPLNPAEVNWARHRSGAFPYRLRQKPGPRNALGRVKFMLPNPYSVYLHDTASPELFQRSVRTFSSGCIRLERPRELLDWLTGASVPWPEAATPVDRTVRLARSVPVHMQYWTAWVEEDGTLQLRPDVYGRDGPLLAALRGPAP